MILSSLTTNTTTPFLLLVVAFLFHSCSVSSFTVESSRCRFLHHCRHHQDAKAAITAAIITAKSSKKPTTFFRGRYYPILILCATEAAADDETQQQEQQSTSSSSSFSNNDNNDSQSWKHKVLYKMSCLRQEAIDYAAQYDLGTYEATVYALFQALRLVQVPLGLSKAPPAQEAAQPILWRRDEIYEAMQILQDTTNNDTSCIIWSNFFTMTDLKKAVSDDFLDAARGSIDNRKGWKVT
jgi:hypothetical protein